MHHELGTLRRQVDTRSRVRLVKPRDFDAGPVRKEERAELDENLVIFGKGRRQRSARSALKQAMKTAEHQKQPISVTHLQHEFGGDERDGSRIALEDRRRSSGGCL